MELSNRPPKISTAFAAAGDRNAIPQTIATPGRASYTQGFPPATRQAKVAGGVPPFGLDFNGAFYEQSIILRWQSAGGMFSYDSAFSAAVSGYPKGAVLLSADSSTEWLSTADSNTTNPDATDGSAANWAPLASYGLGLVPGLTNANVTLLPAQYSKDTIVLSGALTGNVQILFPPLAKRWLVVNNATGAFTLTCKTVAGSGAVLQNGRSEEFYGDGTNLVPRTYPSPFITGEIKWVPFVTPPAGFVKANGASLSVAMYPDLHAVIGYAYGGFGPNFNVPDLRGKFIRGWDDGRGVDPARVFGSDQADELRSHSHTGFTVGNLGTGSLEDAQAFPNYALVGIGSTGGAETRPTNVALLPCIKT